MTTSYKTLFSLIVIGFALAAPSLRAATIQVSNSDITGTVNWYRTNTYVLNGFVFVQNGEVLNIEAGTVIKGAQNATPATIAALVVARGGKIHANGTAPNPIIFTALSDDLDDPLDLPVFQRGLWGGVVLMGRARINTANLSAGNSANPKYDLYEGLPQQEEFLYGGNNDDDSSGSLCYVSIRHGGKVLESNKEINGLSMCGVGRGTTIDFVESYAIADDGFEFFGGTVNTRHLVSAFNDDDCFDTDQGYSGKNQFWFAIQEPGVRDKGMELNGEPVGLSVGNLPLNAWEAFNVTLIGAGAGSGGSGNNAFTIRDYASPSIYNSIFTEFAQRGMSMDATAGGNLTGGTLNFANNLWFGFTGGVNPNSATNLGIDTRAQVLWTESARSNLIVSPMLRDIGRTGFGAALDPRPQAASPALAGNGRAVPNNGIYAPAARQGAFGTVNWAADWTALTTYGIMTGAGGGVASHVTVVIPPQPILGATLSGGDIVISFATITGASYQVQSTTLLVNGGTLWTNEGAPIAGTGGTVTYSAPASVGAKYFRVVAQ